MPALRCWQLFAVSDPADDSLPKRPASDNPRQCQLEVIDPIIQRMWADGTGGAREAGTEPGVCAVHWDQTSCNKAMPRDSKFEGGLRTRPLL